MFGNTFENDLLLLIFNNTNIANVGDATGLRGSTTAGSLYVSLHSADPGEGGNQTTSEISYTGYARVAVARSAAGWTIASNQVSNTAAITFGERTDVGSVDVVWAAVGTDSSGTGKVLARFPVGVATPGKEFTAATTDVITIPGHSLAVDNRVAFHPTPESTLPTGITEGTVYWVKTVASNDITISTTQGGATVDITAAGAGVVNRIIISTVTATVAPQFSAGQLLGQLD